MRKIYKKIIAVGGGKGGVGKSFVSSSIACGLALNGYRVVLVDADLAGANIHTFFGIRFPEFTLNDFLQKKVKAFNDILLSTPLENLSLICGATDILELANPKSAQKEKLINGILDLRTDYIIIDIGAGSSLTNLDFFNLAELGIIVTCVTPTAVQNAYGFLKLGVIRKITTLAHDRPLIKNDIQKILEGSEKSNNMDKLLETIKETDGELAGNILAVLEANNYVLLMNMSTDNDGERIANTLSGVVYHFLKIKMPYLGAIGFDQEVEDSIKKMKPFMLTKDTNLNKAIMKIVKKIIIKTTFVKPVEDKLSEMVSRPLASSKAHLCLNNEIVLEGNTLHILTEDLGMEKSQVMTLVFSEGNILYSKVTEYTQFIEKNTTIIRPMSENVKNQHQNIIKDIYSGKLALSMPTLFL